MLRRRFFVVSPPASNSCDERVRVQGTTKYDNDGVCLLQLTPLSSRSLSMQYVSLLAIEGVIVPSLVGPPLCSPSPTAVLGRPRG